jgi:hypothetical protein
VIHSVDNAGISSFFSNSSEFNLRLSRRGEGRRILPDEILHAQRSLPRYSLRSVWCFARKTFFEIIFTVSDYQQF